MKIVRYGLKGKERPGIIDSDDNLRDLSSIVNDIDAEVLSSEGQEKLKSINLSELALVDDSELRLGVPISNVGKVVCIGLNYVDHAKETGSPIPSEPIMFMKPTSSLNGPNDEVVLPRAVILSESGDENENLYKESDQSDWEVELGVVIGEKARSVSISSALKYIAGYTIVNDVSEREYQLNAAGGQWIRGKGCDTFCPVGPWLVTKDEIHDPQELDVWLEVNGARVQSGNTNTMIFNVKTIVSYVSHFMTLEPGDLIATGTPPGVGMGMKPPKFLKPGDEMKVGIKGLGVQTQNVVKWK
ncbi:MAG: Ureidoglycolate lyase [Alphaproteobacteria bacterium MarineAlpha9_Bin2]|nr:MAG: Ureidoglycolate lyase [Alphaproteobacteria bacterium MarineAlpha9_Bin1]PPR31086.1 MAG: Ureidoglycolate lyase [Alphaproteobacteria bacterium MarineAlpha9_Bin2]